MGVTENTNEQFNSYAFGVRGLFFSWMTLASFSGNGMRHDMNEMLTIVKHVPRFGDTLA